MATASPDSKTRHDSKDRVVFEIEDLAVLDALNDPFRMRIVHATSKQPRTVREIADEFDVPVTRLYYHVNMLTEAGVLEVAATEKVGAMTQRRYRASADDYRLSKRLIESIGDDRVVAAAAASTVLDGAKADAEAMLQRHFADPNDQHSPGALGRTFFTLDPDRVEYWRDRISDLVGEMDAESDTIDDGEIYSFTYVFTLLSGPFKGGTR